MSNAFRNPRLLMPDFWASNGRWRSAQVAVESETARLTWGELTARMNQVGRGLGALGLQPGARVGLLMANDVAYVEALMGVMAGGFVAVPLNPGVTEAAIAVMLADAEVSAVIVTVDHAQRITPPSSLIDGALLCAEGDAPGWRRYEDWRDEQSPEPLDVVIEPGMLCNIIYSSGTTGAPKGIVHTHGQRLAFTEGTAQSLRYHGGCVTLIITGLHSNITWVSLLATLLIGGVLVVRRGFKPDEVMPLIERFGITNFSAVPMQFQRVLEAGGFDRHDIASIRAVMCCGSPLPEQIKRAWIALLPHGFIELFGSTEGVATTLEPEEAPGKMRSVGLPAPGSDIVILGNDDKPVAAGVAGEIAGRTRWMMDGYWRRPDATAEATWIDAHGTPWLRTGDIGRLDEDGYLYVFDRKKDMIVSGGQNVFPADIETVMADHPQVFECAVIGVPDPKWGETPLAVVTPRGDDADADEMLQWTNARVGKFQRVSRVVFLEDLPRNAAGKVLKRELRERLSSVKPD